EDAGGETDWLESLAGDDPRTVVIRRPLVPAEMKFHVERFIPMAADEIVPAAVRQQQAMAAPAGPKKLNELSTKHFPIRPHVAVLTRALAQPATGTLAADLLARIGSHTAQKSLTEMANTPTQPLVARQLAAAAFSSAVRQHGIQLTSREIVHQYDRYNQ